MINFISTSFLLFLLLIGHDRSTCRCLFFTICTTKSASSHVISTSHSNTSSTTYNYVYSPFASYSPLKCFHHHFLSQFTSIRVSVRTTLGSSRLSTKLAKWNTTFDLHRLPPQVSYKHLFPCHSFALAWKRGVHSNRYD